ncbi:glycoside hydrolase family 113 [Fontivita pretiosa]|uniref:glycoside hydrolase family 113 n=1 Tax=Fontivita pretiosa TaxID=2989684 RepID=UPI003D17B33F
MFGRWIILVALATYVVVLSCVVLPGGPSRLSAGERAASADAAAVRRTSAPPRVPAGSRDGLPLCAVGMQIQRTDWIDRYKQSVDEIAALGADAVKFVVDTRMENVRSTRIYLDLRMTPTPEQLAELIRHAKSRGLRVILMPIVLLDNPKGNDWRGVIRPAEEYGGWDDWFDSYRNMLNHFAWIAQGNGVDVFVVGSEFVSAEKHVDQWRQTIAHVRETFKGLLTYSSNWDHYTAVQFWDDLDLIGMNSYWKFGTEGINENPSVEDIIKRWQEIQSDLLPWIQKQGKPLLFLEIGWFSQRNVAYEPWDYTKDQPIDLELQRKLYEGFFRSWWGNPLLGGFSVWEWPPGDGGPDDGGYTPENKPAEKVLRQWLSKPRWEVK